MTVANIQKIELPDCIASTCVTSYTSSKVQGFVSLGYIAPQTLTFEEWLSAGEAIQKIDKFRNFAKGDWMMAGEHKFGEMYSQALDDEWGSYDKLRKLVWVARNVPLENRREDLTWTHHHHVAHLSTQEQREWLEYAAIQKISSGELKQALEQANANRKPLPQPELNWMPEEPKILPIPEAYTNGNGTNGHSTADNTYEQRADDLAGDESGYDWTKEETESPTLTYFDGSPISSQAAGMAVHYSSEKPDWETPQDLFDLLNEEFHFTLDVCAVPETAKCAAYFTPEDDGLAQDWTRNVCWMNPPYGDDIPDWMNKARREARIGATVVCLVPARVDTTWWWDNCIYGEIRFLKGRLKFKQGGNEVTSAPFPSAVIVLSPQTTPTTVWWDWKKQCTDSKSN